MRSIPTSGERMASMPSATTLSASMSRPESVSSRIAKRGWNMCICRISSRFFSPPENPSFTDRVMKESSTSRSFIFSARSLRNCGIGMSCFFGCPSPLLVCSTRRALIAVRRKFATETPGMADGYWNARKMPARARASTGIARRFSPSKTTCPRTILYLGWPMIASESVLLPEPFGPMIACTEPLSITRSMPFKIVFPSTLTTRSRISRLDMGALPGGGLRELRQSHAIERPGDGRLELQPHGARAAVGLAHAVDDRVALRSTDLWLDRSLKRAYHVAGGDLARLARERVPAPCAALAVHETCLTKGRDELLEVGLGQVLALRDRLKRHRSLTPVAREIDHEPHPVFATGRDVECSGRGGISEHFT